MNHKCVKPPRSGSEAHSSAVFKAFPTGASSTLAAYFWLDFHTCSASRTAPERPLISNLLLQPVSGVCDEAWALCSARRLWTPALFLTTECDGGARENGAARGGPDSSAGKGSRQVKGATLILKQFHALLVKRFHHATRSRKDFLAQVPHQGQGYFICTRR